MKSRKRSLSTEIYVSFLIILFLEGQGRFKRETMTISDQFSLRWNEFQNNISTMFGQLKDDPDFADVTLVCEDGQLVEAHRVILAASSTFFQNILKKNNHQHPLIYMRGVNSKVLKSIMDYVYHGEANVYKENLENFMELAAEVKLKGLSRTEGEANLIEPNPPKPTCKLDSNKSNHDETSKEVLEMDEHEEPCAENDSFQTNMVAPDLQESSQELFNLGKTTSEIDEILHSDIKDEASFFEDDALQTDVMHESNQTSDQSLENKVTDLQSLMEVVKPMIGIGQTMGRKQRNNMCRDCGKEGAYTEISNHIETKHIKGISLPCDFCGKSYKTRNILGRHMKKHTSE